MPDLQEITRDSLPDLMKGQGHKYDHGHAVVVAGGPGCTGAARLAARGALRVGAGLVTLACPFRAVPEVAAQVTAIMIKPMDGPTGLAEIMEDNRLGAMCLGPGLGLTQVTAELVRVALSNERACILDADALSRFERAPEQLFKLVTPEVVMTPHWGEFRRLFPDLAEQEPSEVEGRAMLAQKAARRAGCDVLLKGRTSVFARPEGPVAWHQAAGDRAVPWLATAGAGDVLAGIMTGLIARGIKAAQAGPAAIWLHVEAARAFGPGLIAEDLPEMLPGVLSDLHA